MIFQESCVSVERKLKNPVNVNNSCLENQQKKNQREIMLFIGKPIGRSSMINKKNHTDFPSLFLPLVPSSSPLALTLVALYEHIYSDDEFEP